MYRVIICEDQILLRNMIKDKINATSDFKVVADFSDAYEAIEASDTLLPDILVTDVCTENNTNGIDIAGKVKAKHPKIKTMVMTGIPEISFISQAKKANVDSFIYKDMSSDSFVNVLRSTMEGYNLYPAKNNRNDEMLKILKTLSPRELDVLRLSCCALSRKAIASKLHIAEGTVRNCITSILEKTQYSSISDLAIYVVANGFIVPEKLE